MAFFVLCLFMFLSPAQGVLGEAYDIDDYQVHMVLGDDRSCQVTETIDLYFNEDSQGIIRTLPLNSSIEDFTLGNIAVAGDPFVIEEYDGYTDVRIGKEGTYISGNKQYSLSFTRYYYQDYDDEYDWFYADLIPGDWDAAINNGEITIELPAELLEYTLHFAAVGETGGEEDLSVQVEDGVMTVKNLRQIQAGEAITLMAKFPQGTFATAPEKVYPYTVRDYRVVSSLNEEGNLTVREAFTVVFKEDTESVSYALNLKEGVNGQNIQLKNFQMEQGKGNYTNNGTTNAVTLSPENGDYLTGTQSFTLTYDLIFPPDTNEGKDLFLYQFPGVWSCPVEDVTVEINLPTATTAHQALYWHSGDEMGNSDDVETTIKNDKIIFTGLSGLAERQTLGFMLEFPDGTFVKRITTPELMGIILAIASFFLSLFFYFRFGRDEAVAPVVEFYPPDGMNPAEVGYIIDGSADSLDATSLLFYWASHGHLEMEAEKKSFTLYRKSDLDQQHSDYERHAFEKLWESGTGNAVTNTELEGNYFLEVIQIKHGVKASFGKDRKLTDGKAALFSWLSLFLGMLVLPFLPMAAAYNTIGSWSAGWVAYGISFLVFALLGIFLHGRTDRLQKYWYKRSAAQRVWGIFLLVVFLFILIFTLGLFFTIWELQPYTAWACLCGGFLTIIVSVFITKRSVYGQKITERVVGFRDFLRDAEKEKLEALLEENPSYFYDILPYAQVLGVTKIWGQKFADLTVAPPNWYRQDGGDFTTMVFVAHYMTMANLVRHSAITPPRTDPGGSGEGGFGSGGGFGGGGFGGGGFSGGGGGGGGGSW